MVNSTTEQAIPVSTIAEQKDENGKNNYSLNTFYVYLTRGCNMKCRHCWLGPKYDEKGLSYPVLDPDLFRTAIAQAKPLGLSSVKLTGGESLLHPKIKEILAIIKEEKLRLNVETNGALCTPELARALKESYENVFVSVSLDSIDAPVHEWVRGVPGSFERTVQGIKNLTDAGISPQIIMTIMKKNVEQMEPMVRLAEKLGAESVKFNLLQPSERGKAMHQSGETLSIEDLVEKGKWTEKHLRLSTSLRIDYSHPMAFRSLGRLFGKNDSGTCGIFGILGLLADGSYALCGIGETVEDMVFGNAATDNLETVWNNSRMLQSIRAGLPEKLEGVCANCLHKTRCLGSCIAQNYYATGSLWAPFWYCEAAQTAGLFPQSRLRQSPVTQN